jgi:hypothetical protein
MKSLEMLIANPAAAAIGWTLLHSLWEGAIVAAGLGAMLLILRTARARYLAACAALLALLALFTLTLLRLAPQSAQSFPVMDRVVPVWNIVAQDVGSGYWSPNLAAAAPWLALLWMAGVLLMFGRYSASCISVRRFRRRGVCCAPEAQPKKTSRFRSTFSTPTRFIVNHGRERSNTRSWKCYQRHRALRAKMAITPRLEQQAPDTYCTVSVVDPAMPPEFAPMAVVPAAIQLACPAILGALATVATDACDELQ